MDEKTSVRTKYRPQITQPFLIRKAQIINPAHMMKPPKTSVTMVPALSSNIDSVMKKLTVTK